MLNKFENQEHGTPPRSPGGMSPLSPPNSDSYTQPSPLHEENTELVPFERLRSLEARAQVHAAEIASLRQQGEDVTAWRYRVDSASSQTARVLQALDEDLKGIKSRAHAEALSPQPSDQDGQEVCGRLLDIENQLSAARACIDGMNSILNVEIGDLKSSLSKTSALAHSAVQVGFESKECAVSALKQVEALNSEVQTLRLGLEVVEQSLEEVDQPVAESMEALRSRVDALDAGMVFLSEQTNTKVTNVLENVHGLREQVEQVEKCASRADVNAAKAEAIAVAASKIATSLQSDIAVLKETTTPGSTSGRTHQPVMDTRLRAAIHTLSDGYKSLHRAMSLMYEEQSNIAGKVAAVGRAAAHADAEADGKEAKSFAERMKLLEAKAYAKDPKTAAVTVTSHPLPLLQLNREDEYGKGTNQITGEQQQIAYLMAMVGAQARDAIQQSKHIDRLESELMAMRQVLKVLDGPSAVPSAVPTISNRASITQSIRSKEGRVYKTAPAVNGAQATVQLHYDEAGDKVYLKLRLTGDDKNAAIHRLTDSSGWHIPSSQVHAT